jgi:hypothetical protein
MATGDSESGRWKVGSGEECYWDANDNGPNQCYPITGRWKGDGQGGCYWEANDGGPDQCAPPAAPSEPPPNTSIPDPDDSQNPVVTYPQGIGVEVGGPSCASYTKHGDRGYIAVQVNPSNGYIQYGAFMDRPWENYGLWIVQETVNGAQVNLKSVYRNPHGSQPPSVVPPGSTFGVKVKHWFPYLSWFWAYTFVPEANTWMWVPLPSFLVGYADGELSCLR